MANRQSTPIAKPRAKRVSANQRRERVSLAESLGQGVAGRGSGNRRGEPRVARPMEAVIAGVAAEWEDEGVGLLRRVKRWVIGLLLLPLSWVTAWTFFSQFSRATVDQGFWQTEEFWYFATGCLLMAGWFACGLLREWFQVVYVLGHELTHAVFVWLHFGRVSRLRVGRDGGHILTNKTNWLIALSPYFVPFWALVVVVVHLLLRHGVGWEHDWDRVLYALIGATTTFHFVWTLRVIPLDQPDLQENGVFLSLVVIFLGNLLVVSGLFCVAAEDPVASARSFGGEWLRHAAVGGDVVLRWTGGAVSVLREAARL